MHSDPSFWQNNEGYVDFPRDRFLEYTADHVKAEFEELNEETINEIKNIPVLFATEHENSETKIGKITNIEVLPKALRVHFKVDEKPPLFKGVLADPKLNIDANGFEMYRTHWAIKEAALFSFYQKRKISLEGQLDILKDDLDTVQTDDQGREKTNIVTLYAYNGSGKTRISKFFQDQYEEETLCYNAFFEDYFSWDNSDLKLKISTDSWLFNLIVDEGMEGDISSHFKELIGRKIEPNLDQESGKVSFNLTSGDDDAAYDIKISRGEESLFIWSVFYTVLKKTDGFTEDSGLNNIRYIIIDDPVSSMDDYRIVKVALKILDLIKTMPNSFSFLITTHHPLFFNVLFNKTNANKWHKVNYILSRNNKSFELKKQNAESPFAYHHLIIDEIELALNEGILKKYHFNLLRSLLEKFANFLGYSDWKSCLVGINSEDNFLKIINHYSHDRLSELEFAELNENDFETFRNSFESFCRKYKLGEYNV